MNGTQRICPGIPGTPVYEQVSVKSEAVPRPLAGRWEGGWRPAVETAKSLWQDELGGLAKKELEP